MFVGLTVQADAGTNPGGHSAEGTADIPRAHPPRRQATKLPPAFRSSGASARPQEQGLTSQSPRAVRECPGGSWSASTPHIPPPPEMSLPPRCERKKGGGESASGAETAFSVQCFISRQRWTLNPLVQMSKSFQEAEELSPSPRLEGAELGLGHGTLASL